MVDCEHAQMFGSIFPRMRTYPVDPGHLCSASSDLALVVALFVEVQGLVQGDNDLIQLQSGLQSSRQRKKTSAAELLTLPWLKALDTPPSSSSGKTCCRLG